MAMNEDKRKYEGTNDEELVELFFKDAAQQQIEDDGFSERVMSAIDAQYALQDEAAPSSRMVGIQRLWTVFCVLTAILVFVFTQGWTALMSYFAVGFTYVEVFFRTLPTAFDLSNIGSMTANSQFVTMSEIMVALVVLMVLSIIFLTRWVTHRVW